jgi:hypothetical protein
LGYQFTQKSHCVIISLYVGSNAPPTLAKVLSEKVFSDLDGKILGDSKVSFENRPVYGWQAAVTAKFPLETPPQAVATAMRDLIDRTRAAVDASLKQHTSD